MSNDEILDETLADNTFYFTKIYFEITSIYRIDLYGKFEGCQTHSGNGHEGLSNSVLLRIIIPTWCIFRRLLVHKTTLFD